MVAFYGFRWSFVLHRNQINYVYPWTYSIHDQILVNVAYGTGMFIAVVCLKVVQDYVPINVHCISISEIWILKFKSS